MHRPKLGLSWMRGPTFQDAVAPVRARVEAVEWTLEFGFGALPEELERVLDDAADQGALYGHGVHFSLLTDAWTAFEADWLLRAREQARKRRFRWVSEHFGWLRAGGLHAAPLPLPYGRRALQVGRDRLRAIADAVEVPVGIENLALALSADDAAAQADFVDALLEPLDGFVVLDLHNLWCQIVNFGLEPAAALERWPTHRVRALHVSGGSWSEWEESGPFRRDTHDDRVPDEVLALIPLALSRCPNVEVVVLERLPDGLDAAAQAEGLRMDLDRVGGLLARPAPVPAPLTRRRSPVDDDGLAERQIEVLRALSAGDLDAARREPWLAEADSRALRAAEEVTQRWQRALSPAHQRAIAYQRPMPPRS